MNVSKKRYDARCLFAIWKWWIEMCYILIEAHVLYCVYLFYYYSEWICKKAIGILYVCASICILVFGITLMKMKIPIHASRCVWWSNYSNNFTHLRILPFAFSSFCHRCLSLSRQWLEFAVAMMLLFGCKSHDSNSIVFHQNRQQHTECAFDFCCRLVDYTRTTKPECCLCLSHFVIHRYADEIHWKYARVCVQYTNVQYIRVRFTLTTCKQMFACSEVSYQSSHRHIFDVWHSNTSMRFGYRLRCQTNTLVCFALCWMFSFIIINKKISPLRILVFENQLK